MTAAVGLASRPTRSRSRMTRWWLIVSHMPSSRSRANQRQTVRQGGKASGISRHATPPRSTWQMALMTSRMEYARLRPHLAWGGRNGPKMAHSASVRPLPWRSPARLRCARAEPLKVPRAKHVEGRRRGWVPHRSLVRSSQTRRTTIWPGRPALIRSYPRRFETNSECLTQNVAFAIMPLRAIELVAGCERCRTAW